MTYTKYGSIERPRPNILHLTPLNTYQHGCLLAAFAHTVNSEILVKILFSRIALKDIFAMLEIRHLCMIYVYQLTTELSSHLARPLISRNFAYAKFRENKTLAKILEFTVYN